MQNPQYLVADDYSDSSTEIYPSVGLCMFYMNSDIHQQGFHQAKMYGLVSFQYIKHVVSFGLNLMFSPFPFNLSDIGISLTQS